MGTASRARHGDVLSNIGADILKLLVLGSDVRDSKFLRDLLWQALEHAVETIDILLTALGLFATRIALLRAVAVVAAILAGFPAELYWLAQVDRVELDQNVGRSHGQRQVSLRGFLREVDRQVTDFLPDGPVVLHLRQVDILHTVHVEGDLGEGLVAPGLVRGVTEAP